MDPDMKEDLVSIIMSTYNNALYIEKAIQSVLSQTYNNFEFIIINDCSSDNTSQIVNKISDPRIVYIENKENLGLIENLNTGISFAKGKYIARIDSDDYWIDPDKLKKQVFFLEKNSEYSLVGTWARVFDSDGQENFRIKPPINDSEIRRHILLKNCFVHSSVVFRKNMAAEVGAYAEREKYVEDYGLWLRLGKSCKFANIGEYCVGYLYNEGGETQIHNLAQIKANMKLIKKFKLVYPGYTFAKIRWFTKYLLVACGALPLINKTKQHWHNV